MSAIGVAPRGYRAPAAPDRRPMTAIVNQVRRPTFVAPWSDPGGRTRAEVWEADSDDGLWHYARQDDGHGTLWRVDFAPTGQHREGYGTLHHARRETAGGLLDALRREAFTAAFTGPVDRRAEGQRWLAVHMRLIGADEADHRCACGGLLVQATRDGRLAHVDGCAECFVDGQGFTVNGCELAGEHRFCGAPAPVECGHHLYRLRGCGELARPNAGVGCGRGEAGDCCTACCNGE
jgi:hypothetical protein